ncbi:MAG: MarR family winged helix-turn-helix transcriptional regulator, partial [Hydrogenophaga sp.]|nr:MarR family winged helix-turn-helix transcriptional regulator [Hydrogenophaga sp.]
MKNADPSTVNIDLQPGHAIRRLHQISVGIFLQEAGDLGITPVQYAALQVVGNQPGIDQRTLARTIALD